MSLKHLKRYLVPSRSESGDTIIEVMICLAVIGLAIGTGYALTNRSFRYGMSSAERSQAQALAQGQVEFIKDAYLTRSTDPDKRFTTSYLSMPAGSCISDGRGDSAAAGTVLTSNNSQCKVDDLFKIGITYTSAVNGFTVTVTWDSAVSSSQNKTSLFYKVPG